ncbi:RNA-guided endonuclease TnpB family protein [Sulfurihydrogenibium azorense]|nr:RNA-guided endonuclease TnpB family protein [Sulfurihydrogenibium azorense]
MSKDMIVGAYEYRCFANKGKILRVIEVLKEYRKLAKIISNLQWEAFFKTGKFNKYLKLKSIHSNLSERWKQTCQWQVVSVLESFIGNIQNKFKEIVLNSNLNEETKQYLLAINKNKDWFNSDIKYDNEIKKLARKIFKHILSRWNLPSFKHINLHLDSKVAVVEENEKSRAFDRWIKLSTLEKGKPIFLPLQNNTYAEQLEGELLNFCQISVEKDTLIVKLIKKLKDKKKEYIPKTEKIALDVGLNPLFAVNTGDLFGRNFIDYLKKLDEKITKRISSLQKKGIKPSQDMKYVKLVKRLSNFLQNEINRYINRIVELYKPREIVIEKLDFRSPDLSKRMNRLLSNFGKRFINEKLNRLKEIYGIQIVEINPAYTSQTCSSCGYVDIKNRKNTQEFECKACGKKINAQVNGARNILARRSCKDVKIYYSKKQILQILIKRYLERLKGCNSAPLDIVRSNPYFKDYLDDFLNPAVVENKRL